MVNAKKTTLCITPCETRDPSFTNMILSKTCTPLYEIRLQIDLTSHKQHIYLEYYLIYYTANFTANNLF